DVYAQRIFPHLLYGSKFVACVCCSLRGDSKCDGRQAGEGQTIFLETLLEELFGLSGVAAGALCALRTGESWIIARHPGGDNMIGSDDRTFVDIVSNLVFVDRKCEGLTNLDIVKGFGQVVHRVEIGFQQWHLVDLSAWQCFGCGKLWSRDRGLIGLISCVGL